MNALLAIYNLMLAISTALFYHALVKTKARHPEYVSLVMGALWPITVPVLVYNLALGFFQARNKKREK